MARKNTMKMVRALINGKSAYALNDSVKDGIWEYHGNRIAYYKDGDLYVTLCGYNTMTTRERLNQLLTSLGLHRIGFSQKSHEPVIKVDGVVVLKNCADDIWMVQELEDMIKG